MYVITECFIDDNNCPYIGEAEYATDKETAVDCAISFLANHLEDDDAAEEFRERFEVDNMYSGNEYSICIGSLEEY